MRFSTYILALALAATSVLAQGAQPGIVDEVLARDDSFDHSLREIEDVHARNVEEIHYVKRDLERLERRGRMACYAACAAFTGANKVACWRRCDKIWGNTP
ncbi:hypothetical protein M413DRAFT_10466 [Hebeloma cylindrosporum]|uniref:Uncharacterized protein n=1 Tax=Hebeloma cylindrosporum TaxID=76867 RepID=A0A0C2XXB1_HEBCY|nr:hypothetical protein M413DRAFT_10466 [Hebeloma cylindrosporum h7]